MRHRRCRPRCCQNPGRRRRNPGCCPRCRCRRGRGGFPELGEFAVPLGAQPTDKRKVEGARRAHEAPEAAALEHGPQEAGNEAHAEGAHLARTGDGREEGRSTELSRGSANLAGGLTVSARG